MLCYKMRVGIFLFFAFFPFSFAEYVYETHYFTQKVNQFGYANEDTYQQRYLINLTYFQSFSGPLFFYCGNEGSIEMFANNMGFMWETAPQFKAALVFAEHRYYGKSLPYGNSSFKDNAHRGYLSSEQALADYANLIYHLKQTVIPGAENASVITFGGSYGGMLSAWFRMKYPHIVKGAIASSAPIWMSVDSSSCEKFSSIITNDFNMYGNACPALIRRSWSVIRKFGSSRDGAKWLSRTFHLCENLEPSHIDQLIEWINSAWVFLAMVNYPYPSNFLRPLPGYPIKEVCKFLNIYDIDDSTLVTRIFNAISVYQNYTGNVKCFDIKSEATSDLNGVTWNYQECTEMAMPSCSNGINDMFEPVVWNFRKFSETCSKKWNVQPSADKLLITYGGKNINDSSNIIFTNGDLDPWYAGGVLKSLSENLIAITMEGAAHHLDMRSSNPADPPSVIFVRNIIKKWISYWTYY